MERVTIPDGGEVIWSSVVEPGSMFCLGKGGQVKLIRYPDQLLVVDDKGYGGRVPISDPWQPRAVANTIERLKSDVKTQAVVINDRFVNKEWCLSFTLPVVNFLQDPDLLVCERCSSYACKKIIKQTRAADEGDSVVLSCGVCGHQRIAG